MPAVSTPPQNTERWRKPRRPNAATDCADASLSPQVPAFALRNNNLDVEVHVDDSRLPGNVIPRGAVRNRTRDKESWWRLVWCHERCLKEENERLRKVLSEAARERGALLICLKKASKFEKWLVQEHRPPFVLLTDWKEVKPCTQIASLQAQPMQLSFAIAWCESELDFNRVSSWLRNQPARSYPVHVWRDIGCPRSFVHLAYDCLVGNAELPTLIAPRQSTGDPSPLLDDEIPRRDDGGQDQFTKSGVSSVGSVSQEFSVSRRNSGVPRKGSSGGKGRGRGKGRGAARCGKEPAADALASSALPEWSRPVYRYAEPQTALPEAAAGEVNVLSPVCATLSNGQLEQLLKEAIPDHYDE